MKYYSLKLNHNFNSASGKSQFNEPWEHYERIHSDNILFIVIDGILFINIDGIEYTVKAGETIFIKSGEHHVGFRKNNVTFYWIHFATDQLEEITTAQALNINNFKNGTVIFPKHFKLLEINNFIIFTNQLIHYSKKESVAVTQYLINIVLTELTNQFVSTLNMPLESKRRFNEIIAYINAAYMENIKVEDIANEFGYNTKYLTALFKKNLNISPKEYIIDTRLRHAELLLVSSTDTISSIARQCGYNDEFYFMRIFKEKCGMSPTQYRNAYFMQTITKY